jgi:quinol monooxygenase YgiN
LELFVFARFHAREGQEAVLAQAICESVTASREEAGCLNIHAFRSVRGPSLFYIHSRWKDEAAFDLHAELPHTVHFLARVRPLIDHALDVTRTEPCAF